MQLMIVFNKYLVNLHPIFLYKPMKSFILTIILLFFVCNTNAQFYTIGTPKKTVRTAENKPSQAKIEAKTECLPIDTMQTIPNINVLLAQYNSVSYPLRKICITSPFGMRVHPIDKIRKLHNGIDLVAKNEEVYAVLDGIVELTGYNSTSGNYIILKHDAGLTVSYCHLSKNIKTKGDTVRAGDIVAISGNTGKSTNFHLHFVVRKDGKYINPTHLIRYIEAVRNDAIKSYVQSIEG